MPPQLIWEVIQFRQTGGKLNDKISYFVCSEKNDHLPRCVFSMEMEVFENMCAHIIFCVCERLC